MHDFDRGTSSCDSTTDVKVYVIERCKALGVPSPCITFDQPLWLKAVEVSLSQQLQIVIRLGPFHIMMSFFDSLGTLMASSDLNEVLQCCYTKNTVEHMMFGKAVSRAVRGHLLANAAKSAEDVAVVAVPALHNTT